MIVEYNMKPVLLRPQHSFATDNQTYFEVTTNTAMALASHGAFFTVRLLVFVLCKAFSNVDRTTSVTRFRGSKVDADIHSFSYPSLRVLAVSLSAHIGS